MRVVEDPARPDATASPSALLVVEHDFLLEHVGVRRVILYYWQELAALGYLVTLAAPRDGVLHACEPIALAPLIAALRGAQHNDTPCWTSDNPVHRPAAAEPPAAVQMVRWDAGTVLPGDFDVSIITNPWLCARGLPDGPYTGGIVHDIVPNLLACGAISFGAQVDIYSFAHDHDAGAVFFLENVERILCVSGSTRSDFLAFYGAEHAARTEVLIPFIADDAAPVHATERGERRARVLLVNVLDTRKNFKGAAGALKLAAKELRFDVTVVGRERMPLDLVLVFLNDLRSAGLDVEWYSGTSDERLAELYTAADLLLFPSFYEGLGLPILEAQLHGIPTISSNTSSCIEINLNPRLCIDPDDVKALAAGIVAVLDRSEQFEEGASLRAHLAESLAGLNRISRILA